MRLREPLSLGEILMGLLSFVSAFDKLPIRFPERGWALALTPLSFAVGVGIFHLIERTMLLSPEGSPKLFATLPERIGLAVGAICAVIGSIVLTYIVRDPVAIWVSVLVILLVPIFTSSLAFGIFRIYNAVGLRFLRR